MHNVRSAIKVSTHFTGLNPLFLRSYHIDLVYLETGFLIFHYMIWSANSQIHKWNVCTLYIIQVEFENLKSLSDSENGK
jgi:hypothetical protein